MVKLLVALDFAKWDEVLHLVDQLDPNQCGLKVGSELFTRFGPQCVKQLVSRHFKIFLDLKFHDIPNTVASACKAAADLGVWMVNVHALGGVRMMEAAKKSLEGYGKEKPLLIAVTVLTSFNETDLLEVGISQNINAQVNHLALLAKKAGVDGVVCSAHEVKMIKEACETSFIAVTPGIRPASAPVQDQSRVMTVRQAINEGSDFLVIGRPITQALKPDQVVAEILNELH